jgi:membrane protease YdiL (CAAX protease family)
MIGSPVTLEHVLFVLLVFVAPVLEWLWFYPRFVLATRAGTPGARARYYLAGILMEWILVACVIALWASNARPWALLGLGLGTPWRLAIGLALAALYLTVAARQRRRIIARPDGMEMMRRQFAKSGADLVPRTAGERRGFGVLAITAGICEELLYRGFVTWYVGHWTGVPIAVVISSILFGFAHVYLGWPHVVRTTIVGAVFALIVIGTGSLWPAMIIHAAMDLLAGDLGYRAMGEDRLEGADPGGLARA